MIIETIDRLSVWRIPLPQTKHNGPHKTFWAHAARGLDKVDLIGARTASKRDINWTFLSYAVAWISLFHDTFIG